MNAFLAGIGKALSVWPNTDYDHFVPKVRPTVRAWTRAQGQISENWSKIEASYSEVQALNCYTRARKGDIVRINRGDVVDAARQGK
ncbi:hypothetical protein GCM10007938_18100 [Vibrio zhanjiangensis]|uniref:Uncharacterized protein n=1 Tax=Vibrio zhanjiangensis TaxID=1046128 RepID=A0ABQ6EYC7_9VIBR|nr:hypothetical protein [Vibrio zhanjiangensis]GLT18032.1 hypothetical protein GCM10007938_18100 [Vibrio zhanjiangensis]